MKEQLEIERRWILIDSIDLELFKGSSQKLNLTQFYLKNPENKNERLRQIITEERQVSFIHTVKTPAAIGQWEQESEITTEEYVEMLSRIDSKRQVIIKDRYVFPFGQYKLEVDQFIIPVTYRILEIELPSLEVEISIPSFLGRAIEITKEKGLSNYRLSADPKLFEKSIENIINNYEMSSSH